MDGNRNLMTISAAARANGLRTQLVDGWVRAGWLAVVGHRQEYGRWIRVVDARAVATLKATRSRPKLAKANAAADDAARVSEQVARYGVTAAEVIGANAVMYGLLTQDDVRELERRRETCHRNWSRK